MRGRVRGCMCRRHQQERARGKLREARPRPGAHAGAREGTRGLSCGRRSVGDTSCGGKRRESAVGVRGIARAG
eukprot:3382811-Pleurochrysis_carterae.AAC.1